jgi:hypothetical protein
MIDDREKEMEQRVRLPISIDGEAGWTESSSTMEDV